MREGKPSFTAAAVAAARGVARVDPLAQALVDGPLSLVLRAGRLGRGAGGGDQRGDVRPGRPHRDADAGHRRGGSRRGRRRGPAARRPRRGARRARVAHAGARGRRASSRWTTRRRRPTSARGWARGRRRRRTCASWRWTSRKDSLEAALADAGHDAGAPTFWLWEGVTPYLPREAVRATLASIAARSARGSRIAVTYGTPQGSTLGATAVRAARCRLSRDHRRGPRRPAVGGRHAPRAGRGGLPAARGSARRRSGARASGAAGGGCSWSTSGSRSRSATDRFARHAQREGAIAPPHGDEDVVRHRAAQLRARLLHRAAPRRRPRWPRRRRGRARRAPPRCRRRPRRRPPRPARRVSPSVTATLPLAAGPCDAGSGPSSRGSVMRRPTVVRPETTFTPSTRPRPTSGAYASRVTVPSGSSLQRKRPFASVTAMPSGLAPTTSHVGTWSFATRAPATGSPCASTTSPSTAPSAASSMRGIGEGAAAGAVGDGELARDRGEAGRAHVEPRGPGRELAQREGAVRVGARAPHAEVGVERHLRARDGVAPARGHDLARRALGRGRARPAATRSVPSVVTIFGACPGALTSTRSGRPRARLRLASPRASVNAVVRSGASGDERARAHLRRVDALVAVVDDRDRRAPRAARAGAR